MIDIKTVEALIEDGLCKEQIIRHLKVPSTSFYTFLKKNNIVVPKAKRYLSDKDRYTALSLLESGLGITAIANQMGKDISSIRKLIGNRLPKRKQKADVDRIVLLHKEGRTIREIGHLVGISPAAISRILSRRGLIPSKSLGVCEDKGGDIIELIKQEKTQVEICSILGLHSNTLNNFLKRHSLSDKINKNLKYQSSQAEKELLIFLEKYNPIHKFKYQGNKEIDIYLPNFNLGIELCGLYWHRESIRGKKHLVEKMNDCKKMGIRLLTIFDYEWKDRRHVIESIILSKIKGANTIIYGRKCTSMAINSEQANDFFYLYHLQGSPPNILKSWGLFYQDQLVGAMSIGKHHRNGQLILNRLALKGGVSVIGGPSKLFANVKKFLKDSNPQSIITYSDNRFSSGNVYQQLGFVLEKNLPIDYFYTSGKRIHSKQSMKKTAQEKESGKTEYQLRLEQGLDRVWDCGKIKWLYLSDFNL